MGKTKIVSIGSSNVDLIMKMARLPRVGETVTDAIFMQTFGGKGANQAYAAAQAGGEVVFVSCVGSDAYGQQVIDNMRAGGCDVAHVFVEPDTATGTALIMIGEAGQNYLSVAPGANYRLTRQHLDQADAALEHAALVMLQYEITPDALGSAIERCVARKIPVMFNLAPARPLDERLLASIDYLIVNETEAAFLCGFDVDSDANVRRAAANLQQRGARTVIITLGAQGAYVLAQSGAGDLVPSYGVDAIDTTAAGDTFCGALAVGLLEQKPLLDAVRFANAASAISVTRIGAQASIPNRREIEAFVAAQRSR